MKELRISKRFYFTGAIVDDSSDIYLDINCSGYNKNYYEEITKEKAKEIIKFLTDFVKA